MPMELSNSLHSSPPPFPFFPFSYGAGIKLSLLEVEGRSIAIRGMYEWNNCCSRGVGTTHTDSYGNASRLRISRREFPKELVRESGRAIFEAKAGESVIESHFLVHGLTRRGLI